MQVINYVVYVCICRVYFDVFQKYTSHEFVYHSHFSQLEKNECCGAMIDNRSYASIFLLEEIGRTCKTTKNNVFMIFFKGGCIVDYSFKVTGGKIITYNG